jgi:hypothetical protein
MSDLGFIDEYSAGNATDPDYSSDVVLETLVFRKR